MTGKDFQPDRPATRWAFALAGFRTEMDTRSVPPVGFFGDERSKGRGRWLLPPGAAPAHRRAYPIVAGMNPGMLTEIEIGFIGKFAAGMAEGQWHRRLAPG
jgi:hypothetical protein